jgi:uracil-DNA glycosylase family 4
VTMSEDVAITAQILDDIAAEVRVCSLCPLARGRTNAVPGVGAPGARIMFIGEGPGEQEDLQGKPFVGPAGKLLDQLLRRVGLSREEVFITNIVKCRPPGNREPMPDEVAACKPYLDGQIAAIWPSVICLLGRPAVATVLAVSQAMNKIHGQILERDGVKYVPLYHPAAALHQQSLAPVLLADIVKLKPLLTGEG